MRPDLYISADSQPHLTLVDGTLDSSWQRIGELDGSREAEAWKRVKPFIGLGGGSGTGVTFWIDGDSESPFVQTITARAPGIVRGADTAQLRDVQFWLALDLRRYHHRYLISVARATFRATNRRPPEPHPAYSTKPTFLPIHLAASGGAVFQPVDV